MFIIQSLEYEWEKSQRGAKFASQRSLLPQTLSLDCLPDYDRGIALDNRGRFLKHSKDFISCDRFNIKYSIDPDLLEVELLGIQPAYGFPPSIRVNQDEWIQLKYNYRKVDGNHSRWFFGLRTINVGNFATFKSDVFLTKNARRIYDFQRNIYRINK